MERKFVFLEQTRKNIIAVCDTLTYEQLNKIPAGFKNNILWNVVHLHVSEQILIYSLCKISPLRTDNELMKLYRIGTVPPEEPMEEKEFEQIKKDYIDEVEKLKSDYKANVFKEFRQYKTSYGVELYNLEDAVDFNNIHESVHYGYILALRKAIKA